MPALELPAQENNEEPGPINAVVGIIYPPPEVRSILSIYIPMYRYFSNIIRSVCYYYSNVIQL